MDEQLLLRFISRQSTIDRANAQGGIMESLKIQMLCDASMPREKKLGLENAKKVLKAFEKDAQHFGFINVSEKELAELMVMYNPPKMNSRRDVFSFRAGCWVILIVVADSYVEVTCINPYDLEERFSISDI